MANYRNGMPADTIDVTWIKSTASAPTGQCVELAVVETRDLVVRNSRDPQGPALLFTPGEFEAFVQGAKRGEFDHLIEI
ncbi:DUF397 domain-containing protein [Kitasatospora sp. NPDC051984]|uniref:DUF397 domain-containing protein n=1 Tax=Kitasatospora sp. NPDC051984 TaxID=3364059 RepID=UPI0037C5626D